MRFLRRLNITQALGLPNSLGPKKVAALARSVTVASGEAWIGTDDHVVRRIRARGEMVVASKDRKLLFGIRSAKLDAALDISEIGEAQKISAPRIRTPTARCSSRSTRSASHVRRLSPARRLTTKRPLSGG